MLVWMLMEGAIKSVQCQKKFKLIAIILKNK